MFDFTACLIVKYDTRRCIISKVLFYTESVKTRRFVWLAVCMKCITGTQPVLYILTVLTDVSFLTDYFLSTF